jgi:hypothetical protein
MAETLKDIRERLQKIASNYVKPIRKIVSFDQYKTWKYLQGSNSNSKLREHILFPNSKGYQPSNELECPYCGGGHTHHIGVEIFDNAEDNKNGDHFTFWCKQSYGWDYLGQSEGMEISIPNDSFDNDCSNNRGYRRGSVQLHCVCEGCSQMFSIIIAQMKGVTQAGVERDLGVKK